MSLKKLSTLLKHTDTQKLTALWEITPIRFLFWQHVYEDHLLVIDATFMYNVQANDIKMSLLLHLGRDYPKGYDYFRGKLKNAFFKHKDVTDPKQIEMLLARGNYVVKELEALYMLRKYRTLKKRYYSD